ncbi:uncharacterized protein LOC134532149 [Bacillus rossius redtenbacheri]|uniref:uncharacterized protein LOC134532149 n=1 Tax=Bacillus rossius redtenbacheri TaxID=93214 RepID=UPI002FDDA9DD
MAALVLAGVALLTGLVVAEPPPYVRQCNATDPRLTDCFIAALHHLQPFVARGIPEIEMPAVEPFRMEELSLALTTGPNGYRITLKDIDIHGVSNFTVTRLRLGEKGKPFEARVHFPKLDIAARYTSSGVLIILPASGSGLFHASLGDIIADIKGTVSSSRKNDLDYLHVDTLGLNLNINTARMGVKKVFNNNRILTEATNLFLRENGLEVVSLMMPQLKTKLAAVFQQISNQLLQHVPTQMFLLQ